jgi:hypothetical protein
MVVVRAFAGGIAREEKFHEQEHQLHADGAEPDDQPGTAMLFFS